MQLVKMWDSMQEVLTGGFITLNACMREGEISKVNKLLPKGTMGQHSHYTGPRRRRERERT